MLKRAERAFAAGRFASAAKTFRELADAGNVDGQLRLAQLYEHGQGVLQSSSNRYAGFAPRRNKAPCLHRPDWVRSI